MVRHGPGDSGTLEKQDPVKGPRKIDRVTLRVSYLEAAGD